MIKNEVFEQLVEEIKNKKDFCSINVYCGNVNGDYCYEIIDKNQNFNCIDILKTDGEVSSSKDEEGKTILSIENCNYAIICTITNNNKNEDYKLKVTDYSIILDPAAFGYFQSFLLNNNESDLFENITNEEGYLRGNLNNFKIKEKEKGISIYPIIEKTKNKVRIKK